MYGRVLTGDPDELVGWVCTAIAVPAWHKAAAAGLSHYANLEPDARSRVAGTVFEITNEELAVTDAYERDAEYRRLATVLASGRTAWIYVSHG